MRRDAPVGGNEAREPDEAVEMAPAVIGIILRITCNTASPVQPAKIDQHVFRKSENCGSMDRLPDVAAPLSTVRRRGGKVNASKGKVNGPPGNAFFDRVTHKSLKRPDSQERIKVKNQARTHPDLRRTS